MLPAAEMMGTGEICLLSTLRPPFAASGFPLFYGGKNVHLTIFLLSLSYIFNCIFQNWGGKTFLKVEQLPPHSTPVDLPLAVFTAFNN